jgi:mono/diheme cytochrome c family protein
VLAVAAFALKIQLGGVPHYEPKKVDLHVEVTPERMARGRWWASMLCVGCHANVQTGKLTGEDMHIDAQFGKVYSSNITRHATKGIGSWTDGELAYLLRTGVARDGRYTPPWMVKLQHMSDDDLQSVIAFLHSDDPMVEPADVDSIPAKPNFLSKFLATVVFKPYPYPDHAIVAPDRADKVAYGRYLAWNLDCYPCHSPDFAKVNPLDPPKTDGYFSGGNGVEGVASANLTPDPETGIGKWSEADFVRALREGVRPDNTAVRYPMNAYSLLSVEEAAAIYAYLKTVPAVTHAVARTPAPPITAEMSAGKKVYTKYACTGCHGDGGLANCDLTKNRAHYPADDDLIAFIRDPSSKNPGSRMPAWKNVIPDEELKELVAHVRVLDKSPPPQQPTGGTR